MTFQIGLTLVMVFVAVVALMATRASTDLVLLGCLTVLLIAGVVSPDAALKEGFGNEGLITVGVLFVVAEGLQQTGAVTVIAQRLLGRPKSRAAAQTRLMIPTAAVSAFLNNTPVVAVLMPILDDWARKCRLPPSQLLLPLSYAAVLGGLCTLIGTSTTLVLNELMVEADLGGLTMFEIGRVGVWCCGLGLVYILLLSKPLLPNRRTALDAMSDPREYTVEMLVDAGSALIGKTIERAGLRHLPGAFLMEIDRDGHVLAAVSPNERLQPGDRLVFVGVVESVVDLQKIAGLTPATDQVFKLDSPRAERCLIEAVVSNTCPIVNMTIREARFRTRYNAAVIAVSRNGQRLRGKIGDIVLVPGDTLLLEAHPSFADLQRDSRDFYLVSRVDDSTPLRHERAWIAQGILLVMVGLVTFGDWSMLNASLLAAGAMLVTRCVHGTEARRSIEWSVLLTIAAGLGIGAAMKSSGTADYVATSLIALSGGDELWALATVYGITMVFTNLITAKAAAVLIFPIAIGTADALDVNARPFAIAVAIAAAASFATPIGYQTNLMVYGPGGYRYSDYVRFGGPLSLLIWALSMWLIPTYWPL